MSVSPIVLLPKTGRRRGAGLLRLGFALLAGAALAGPTFAAKWDPVDPAILAAPQSSVDPGLDLEIIRSEHLFEETQGQIYTNGYVQAKVYTEKGVHDIGKLMIRCSNASDKAEKIEARVVKPDGTSAELAKADVFETEWARFPGAKFKQYSFAFPDVAAGDVVEFRWLLSRRASPWYVWSFNYECQQAAPVRDYKFTVGALSRDRRVLWYNCPDMQESHPGGDLVLTMHNIPAYEPEPNMPPEHELLRWISIQQGAWHGYSEKDMWKKLRQYWCNEFLAASAPGGTLRKKVKELVAGASDDLEKLARLEEFCRDPGNVLNIEGLNGATQQAAKQKEIESLRSEDFMKYRFAGHTLDCGVGRPVDINILFAAMARAAGFEVQWVRAPDRREMLDPRKDRGWGFLTEDSIMVRVGDQWRFYAPGGFYNAAGTVPTTQAGTSALLCASDKLEFTTIPYAPADQSRIDRRGRFSLDAEGTLEGDVEILLTGHTAADRKRQCSASSEGDDERVLREEIVAKLPSAEVTAVAWTNLHNNVHPVSVKYHLRVPGYATQLGSRLVLVPSVFCVGVPMEFTSPTRRYPIMFDYAREEHDDIEIVLPAGFALDQPTAPASAGDIAAVIGTTYHLEYNPKTRTFGYKRDFALGASGALAFLPASYEALKELFAAVHDSDNHSIMLKPREPKPAATAAAPGHS